MYLTVPMVFGFFAMVMFNLADTYFVAQLGTVELAAMSFTFPVVLLVHSAALGLGIGTASVVSRATGEGNRDKVRRFTTDGLLLTLLVVVLFVAFGLATIDPVFMMLGAGPETLPLVRQYMTIWYVGMIFVAVPMVGNNAIRATGDTKSPAFIMMVAATFNICLDPLLIFGLAGFPRLELAGAALATVIGRALSMTLSLSILHFREKMLDFSLRRVRTMWDSWKKILYIGIPSAATNILAPLSMAVIIRIVARFGAGAVAAVGTGTRIQAFAMLVVMALGASLIPFIGQNWGAGKFGRVHLAQKYSTRFSVCWGIGCVAVFLLTAGAIADLFSHDPEVVDGIVSYLWIVPLGFGLQGVSLLASASFNAVNRPLTAAALSFVRVFALGVPLAYMGAQLLGLKGAFAGISLGNIIAGLIAMLVLRHAGKR